MLPNLVTIHGEDDDDHLYGQALVPKLGEQFIEQLAEGQPTTKYAVLSISTHGISTALRRAVAVREVNGCTKEGTGQQTTSVRGLPPSCLEMCEFKPQRIHAYVPHLLAASLRPAT